MMTNDEIDQTTVNIDIAREAFQHVTLRLQDILSAKDGYDQKLSALFSGYVAICLALMAAAAAAATQPTFEWLAVHLFFDGIMFAVGALCLALALIGMAYGSAGSAPETWLRPGIIDGDNVKSAMLIALIVRDHDSRISESIESNRKKARAIVVGITLAFCATSHLCLVVIAFAFSDFV